MIALPGQTTIVVCKTSPCLQVRGGAGDLTDALDPNLGRVRR
jgi:hypothetical protein